MKRKNNLSEEGVEAAEATAISEEVEVEVVKKGEDGEITTSQENIEGAGGTMKEAEIKRKEDCREGLDIMKKEGIEEPGIMKIGEDIEEEGTMKKVVIAVAANLKTEIIKKTIGSNASPNIVTLLKTPTQCCTRKKKAKNQKQKMATLPILKRLLSSIKRSK